MLKPVCFPLKTFLFALYISALSPSCPLRPNTSFFLTLFYFIFSLPPSFFSRSVPLPSLLPHFSIATARDSSPPLSMINQKCGQRRAVRGISRATDEISGAHLSALYGDLLGRDKQQAGHHSQPNRLPACMCSVLLRRHRHCHCQGWSGPRRPALWSRKPSPALWIITFY